MKYSKFTVCAAVLLAAVATVSMLGGCGKDQKENETTTVETVETTSENGETPTSDNAETSAGATENETAVTSSDGTSSVTSVSEETTKKESETVSEQEKTTAANSNTVTDGSTQATPANSEFNIIIGKAFYITGKSIDSDGTVTPLEIAKTDKSLYMLSDFDGIEMGALINGETAYMICPEKKAYLEITASLRKTMGIDDAGMFDISSYSFSDLGGLDKADNVEQGYDFQGASCTAYTFNREKSKTVFCMNGDRLLGFITANSDGTEPVTTVVTKISADVPADRIEPSSEYKGYKGVVGAIRFMAAVGIEDK